jgi:uncharacterized protein (TIGR00290 family)
VRVRKVADRIHGLFTRKTLRVAGKYAPRPMVQKPPPWSPRAPFPPQKQRRVALFWSTGKDSAWAFHRLCSDGWEVRWLVTTIHEKNGRVAVHGVRRELLAAQAHAFGVELVTVPLPENVPNAVYRERVGQALQRLAQGGCTHVGAGDVFLQDVRRFREELIWDAGFQPLFPLWTEPTRTLELAEEMLAGGLRACIVAVDPGRVPHTWLGRPWDRTFLEVLGRQADPLGERGEFHTLALDGPGFREPLRVRLGTHVERRGLPTEWIDLQLAEDPRSFSGPAISESSPPRG